MTLPYFRLLQRCRPAVFAWMALSFGTLQAEPTRAGHAILELEEIQAGSPGGKISGKDRSVFWRLFDEAAAGADGPQLAQLAAIFARLQPDSTERNILGLPLLSGGLRLAVEKLKPGPIRTEFPAPPSAKANPKISADLNAAWNSYRAAVRPFHALVKEAEARPRIQFQTHQSQYWQRIHDLLLQKPGSRAEDFLAYEWGGMCGTGSASFRAPNSHAVLLSLLQEKRYPEAVGAALGLEQGDFSGSEFDAQEFLSLCTPDWEPIVAGALAENILGNPETRSLGDSQNLLRMLGRHGSKKSADRLIELAELADGPTRPDYVKTLGIFLGPTRKENEASPADLSGSDLSDMAREAEPVSLATRQKILEFFDRVSGPKASFKTCEAVASSLSGKDFPSAKPVLQRLLHHPSEDVSREAAESLDSLGEKFVPPVPPAPVSFLVRFNGEPLKNCQLAWGVGSKKSGYVTSEARTTASGSLPLPYKYFIDPARPVEFVRISTPDGKSPEAPLFDVLLPKPKELDKEQPVPVKTRALDLRLLLPKSQASYKDKDMQVSIQRTGTESIPGSLPKSSFTTPITGRILFSQLQEGSYRLKLNLPGAAKFESDLPSLGSSPFEVKLEPGSDVQFKLVAPKGWRPENLQRGLLRGGKEIQIYEYLNYQTGGLSGLPVGEYVLRIPAGKDQRNRLEEDDSGVENFEAAEIPFRIDTQSPAILDLGEIKLNPVKT